jgi:hypothetical protein
MRGVIVVALGLFFIQSASADLIYLRDGNVYAGTIVEMNDSSVEIELSDGSLLRFSVTDIFQVTDDGGKVLFDGSRTIPADPQQSLPEIQIESTMQDPQLVQSIEEYRTVVRFPFWPVLGGTAILGYFGVTQLQQSADSYAKSQELEESGLEFNEERNRSLKQRNWGQICIAGAVACLVAGLTPRFEKVPVQTSWKVTPTDRGLLLTINF